MAGPSRVTSIAIDMWRAERDSGSGLLPRRDSRLAALVDHARKCSPYYRHLYSRVPPGAPLTALPPVAKRDLMASFDDWVTDPDVTRADVDRFIADRSLLGQLYRGRYFVCTSSGTTGTPGVFVHDPGAVAVYRAMGIARIDRRWLPPRTWFAMLRHQLRWAAVVGTENHYAGAGWMESERRRSRWRRRAYSVFPIQTALPALVDALDAFDPAVLTSYPSGLDLLAEQQECGRLHLRPAVVESGGETLLPQQRARIREAFGCPVREVYAASEFDPMAFSCDHGWLHVSADWVILEPVDAGLRPTPPGEPSHTVLLTNLANHVQPMIRYDLGDSVLVRPDPCPCGIPLPAIRVDGRSDDVLHLRAANGEVVDVLPLAIGSIVDETAGVRRCQLVQAEPAAIRLRLDAGPDADVEGVWQTLSDRLRAYLTAQGLPDVDLVRTDEPPTSTPNSGKFHQVVRTAPMSS